MKQTIKRICTTMAAVLMAAMPLCPVSALIADKGEEAQAVLPQETEDLSLPEADYLELEPVVNDKFFDNVVFVGDSISLKLKNYVTKQRRREKGFFGKAQFLTEGGLGSGNVQMPIEAGSLHPKYNGQKMYLEDSVAATGAQKMYIMFGMNDIAMYGIDGSITNLETLIEKILEKSPELEVIVQSVTPILEEKQQRNLNNPNVMLYNAKLEELCSAHGYTFLDAASVLRNRGGSLIPEFCGDAPGMGMHLSDAGCVAWIQYLRANPVGDYDETMEYGYEQEEPDEEEATDEEEETLPEAVPAY